MFVYDFVSLYKFIPEALGKMNVFYVDSISEQRCDVLRHEACYATADRGNEKSLLRVRLGVSDELVNIRIPS